MKYICNDCESKVETFEKDGVTIVYRCAYCDEQAATIARMLNGKMDKICQDRKRLSVVGSEGGQANVETIAKDNWQIINKGLSLRELVEGLGHAQKAMLKGR